MRILSLAALALLAMACAGGQRQQLRVFAAASLVDAFSRIEELYESANPDVDVVVQPGGSIQLATQIEEGAPADVFASASETVMDIVTDSPDGTFATNQLVIVTPAGNPGGVEGLADLADSSLVLAVCDPDVPCGDLAAAVLADAGISVSPDTREPNVRAVLNKVTLDEVDAGLVYRSDAVAAGDSVEAIQIDSPLVNRYPITTLSDSAAASAFVALVLSDQGEAVFEEAGFGAP